MRISDWSSDVCSSDLFTIEAAKKMVTTHDPELMFVNLGDVDRVGHADLNGTTLQLARRAALVNTDVQVKSFIDMLKPPGRSEQRRVGKGCVRTCRSRRSAYYYKKNTYTRQHIK